MKKFIHTYFYTTNSIRIIKENDEANTKTRMLLYVTEPLVLGTTIISSAMTTENKETELSYYFEQKKYEIT
ncbi:hypothetical protein [Carnobacterium sp. 17-4]|uniref:hypothetical protein n=1 Tax=Carnobacterium sp. (strain 17-4) TaxID=208596 RepID=UPI0011D1C3AA|nr:hypothetical protein [Carnobacterium sp. 17-4]